MPLRQTVAQLIFLAATLGGAGALETRYGGFAATLAPLPQEEISFGIAQFGPSPGGMMQQPSQGIMQQPQNMMQQPQNMMQPSPGGFPGQNPQGGFPGQPPEGGFPGQSPGGRFPSQSPQEESPGGRPFSGPRFSEEQGDQGQQEQFERQQNEQCKRQARQGATQMSRSLTMVERKLAGLVRQAVSVPTEVSDLVNQLKALVLQIKNLEDCEGMGEIGPQFGELMRDLMENLQKLEQRAFLPRMKKEITRQFNLEKKNWQRAVSRASRAKGVDLLEILTRGNEILAGLEQRKNETLAAIDQCLASNDLDCVEEIGLKGEGVEDEAQELRELASTIFSVVDSGRQFSLLKRERKNFDRQIRDLKRAKKDPAAVQTCLTELDGAIAAVQAVLGAKPLDSENLLDTFRAAWDQVGECNDLVRQAFGTSVLDDAPDVFGEIKAPSFSLPASNGGR